MHMASMRESRDSDRFLVNSQVQSHALLRRGFGPSVPFIIVSVPDNAGMNILIIMHLVSEATD